MLDLDEASGANQNTARARHGANIGQPYTRREGRLKVTGAAIYAADNHPPGMLYAVIAVSAIARGRVVCLDLEAARQHPGVVEVMTPANAPKLALHPDEKPGFFTYCLDLLQDDRVRYANQPIAVVIAQTLEAATEAALLLAPRYEAEHAPVGLDAGEAFTTPWVGLGEPSEVSKGDLAAGLASAAMSIDATFQTPMQYHNPLEPHAIVAEWNGGMLTIDTPSQAMTMAIDRIAGLFGIDPGNIHLRTPFIGGGFGSKAFISGPQILGVMAARLVDRPVKLTMSRDQMFGPLGHRPQTRQRIRLAADAGGHLAAVSHHTRTATSAFDDYFEAASGVSKSLYASPALATSYEVVRVSTGTPSYMRAPGEAPGSAALESAMDELAEACKIDPLEFRLRNYAEAEPVSGKPFSSKALRECYLEGAKQFGWQGRPREARQMRDDSGLLVGWGVGTAIYPSMMFAAEAHAEIRADGFGMVEIGAHDMGQGAWTSLAQIAADSLGLDMERLDFRMGASTMPGTSLAGGSAHTATAGTAVLDAGSKVVAELIQLAVGDERSPLFAAGNAGVIAYGGRLIHRHDPNRHEAYETVLRRAGLDKVQASGQGARDQQASDTYAMYAHGAVFAEVKVDPDLCQIRCTRLVGAFAAARIINPQLVRSQYFGGMIWGLSFALHERAVMDTRSARVMNANLADYHIPVNADVPSIEAILIEEVDEHVNALGTKGVGELAITGTVGAIANAIRHATGVRVREFPITLDRLL